jgi:hypothetical protein
MPLPEVAAVVLAAALAAGCASASGGGAPVDPRSMAPPGVKPEWLHFVDPVVEVGRPAPDFNLSTPDGETHLSLSTFQGRPLVVAFGSYT